jgi:hypothetical protein
MKKTEFADEPNVSLAILDDVIDPADKPPAFVIAVMRKGFRLRVKPVHPAIFSQPEIATTVACDTPNGIAAKAVGVPGVWNVSLTSLGHGIESVDARMSSDPQITMVVFYEISNEVVAQAPGIIGVVFEYHEGVAVIAVEALTSRKPHETPVILQYCDNIVLREAIAGGEVDEFEVPQLRLCRGNIGVTRAGFGDRRVRMPLAWFGDRN